MPYKDGHEKGVILKFNSKVETIATDEHLQVFNKRHHLKSLE